MQVKTFEAMTIKEAIKSVKAEFGNDAVILNTRKKNSSEMGSGGSMVEVTAAVPDRKLGASSQHLPVAVANLDSETSKDFQELSNRLAWMEQKLSYLAENSPSKNRMYGVESSLDELKLLVLEVLKSHEPENIEISNPVFAELYQRLKVMGVEESHLHELVKHLHQIELDTDALKSPDKRQEIIFNHVAKWLYKRITIASKWTILPGSPSIHVFCGPTGTGKTSILAKIAAQFAIKEKINTVLVSFDHQRLAAAEQLRVYARVMNINFDTIVRAEELSSVIERNRDAQLILVDTAGRSPKSQNFSTELQALNRIQMPIEKHLVLSCTEKAMQLDRAVRQYSSFGIQSLIFTKLDESWSYGDIFNLQAKWSLPLSYFGTGQSVPEDMERATRERVVERLLGKNKESLQNKK